MSTSKSEPASKVEAIMARIRATLPAGAAGSSKYGGSRTRPGEERLFPEDLYRSLHQARTIGGGISVDYRLGWRTPILGQIWMRIRQRIHQEIRIYIDALTTQQSNLNGYLIRVATHMVETLDELGLRTMKREQREQAELLAALQDEVRALRREVEQLRAERTTVPIDERSSNGVAHGG
ncbi:MAG TPA: hypothetical protein VKX96_03815 [Chloroflexota bacterium]|nr:hypothetical protein [Chloroflexota bacterium]